MVEGIVVYLGNTQIATNFYNRTESQKVKRPALGLGHYDILSLEHILKISDECDKLFIVGLNKKVTPDKFLFNYLIENGLDMDRVTTFNGSMNIRMKHSGSGLSEKEYSKFLLQDTMNYSDDYSTASKLIIETMKSLHRLYWSTGRVNRIILKLINLIKENCSSISLYACDSSNIAFAVPRSVEKRQLINRVKEIVLQLNLQDCFDYIVIGNSLSNPWRADRQDITVYEIDNKQER